jgi:hypothetical protein
MEYSPGRIRSTKPTSWDCCCSSNHSNSIKFSENTKLFTQLQEKHPAKILDTPQKSDAALDALRPQDQD